MTDAKTNAFENSLLRLIFNAITIANVADNAGAAPLTSLQVTLHTATPSEGGTQLTSEAAYGNYNRVAVSRTTTGWTVTGNSVSPAANIDFNQATSGSETITHFGVGSATSGAGALYYYGTVTPNIVVSAGVTPRLTTASTITEN
jgi:hypothetical protein